VGLLSRLFGPREADADQQDEQVMAALRHAGADLSQPREVIHYLYLPTEAATHAAVARIDRDDRFVHAVIDPETGKSRIKMTHTAVVTLDAMRALRLELESAAAEGGGEYDGWEAAATP